MIWSHSQDGREPPSTGHQPIKHTTIENDQSNISHKYTEDLQIPLTLF